MVSRKTLSLFLTVMFLAGFCQWACAGDIVGEDQSLTEKSNTELIAMERALKEKLGKDPGNADLYYQLSEVYTILFDRTRKKSAQSNEWIQKSADALERTVMLKPGHKTALYNLGVIYKRQGKMERAREELRKAIRACDPEEDGYLLMAIWMQIGSIYEEQGFFDEAKQAYEKAREYDYGSDDVRSALEDLKERKAAAAEGSASAYNFSPAGIMGPIGPAARSYDPMSGADMQRQGFEQALPALTSALSKNFSGSKSSQDDEAGLYQ